MENVRKLKIAEQDLPSSQLVLEKFDGQVKEMRDFLEKNHSCGYAIVCYSKEKKGVLSTVATYFVDDPLDAYALPDLAKAHITNIRDNVD